MAVNLFMPTVYLSLKQHKKHLKNRFILDFSSFYHLQTIIEIFVLDQYFLYSDLVQKPWKLQGTNMNIYSNCQYIILPVTSHIQASCVSFKFFFNLAMTLQLLSVIWRTQNLSAFTFYVGNILSMVTSLLLPGI